MTEIDFFFEPKSIAIIGASDKLRFGYTTTKYLLNSKFKTFPVHLYRTEILGHKTYKNIKDIPENIELAILLVPNERVLQAVKDCAEKGSCDLQQMCRNLAKLEFFNTVVAIVWLVR